MLDLFNSYRGYLGQIEEAQRLADQLNMDQGILNTTVAPVQQVTPAANEQEGIFSLLDGNTATGTNTNTPGSGRFSYTDILGFLTNPIAFGINKGIGALTGRTATDRIKSALSSFARNNLQPPSGSIGNFYSGGFGSIDSDQVGTAVDPSTMASEDPSAIGSQSGGDSSGADSASAAGANDGPDTGGSF